MIVDSDCARIRISIRAAEMNDTQLTIVPNPRTIAVMGRILVRMYTTIRESTHWSNRAVHRLVIYECFDLNGLRA